LTSVTRTRVLTLSITVFALLLLLAATAFAQETSGNEQKTTKENAVSKSTSDSAKRLTVAESQLRTVAPVILFENSRSARPVPPPLPANDDDAWHFEVRPYIWAAGIYGTLRVGTETAETGNGSASVLGMLDFAAAAQVEAIKGRWRIMIDENYVNLGTDATGPGGLETIDVQPTQNIFEVGGSYMFAEVPNDKSTTAEPLPPAFTAEALAGVRWFHLGLRLQRKPNSPLALPPPPVEGSRDLFGPFVGARLKGSPHKDITLIGKFTVGGSGAGSNFAWSAEGLLDWRLKKSFSLGGGYRVLGMNADQPSNNVGFDGQMRGLVLNMTLYR
jgi:hypothetical protein